MWKREDWKSLLDQVTAPDLPMNMDGRHVQFLYHAALVGGFARVLEVGCFKGYSTSALVQAMVDGAAFVLSCCDIDVRPELRRVASGAPGRVLIDGRRSEIVIDGSHDLIILDGDHMIECTAREVGLMLLHGTETVIAHDVAWYSGWCTGTRFIRDVFQAHPDYLCRVDAKARPGEFTDRGFLVATRSPAVYRRLGPAWEAMLCEK